MGDLPNSGTSSYPTSLDTATTIVASDALIPSRDNGPNAAIVNIETELGTGLKGSVADLATRLNVALAASGAIVAAPTAWTPSDNSGANLVLTVVADGNQYIKIGRFVAVWMDFTYPVTASGATAQVTGLPATSQNSTNTIGAACFSSQTTGVVLSANVVVNSTSFGFRNGTSNAQLTNANMSGATVKGVLIYLAAA